MGLFGNDRTTQTTTYTTETYSDAFNSTYAPTTNQSEVGNTSIAVNQPQPMSLQSIGPVALIGLLGLGAIILLRR
jgi:hypothetical protein